MARKTKSEDVYSYSSTPIKTLTYVMSNRGNKYYILKSIFQYLNSISPVKIFSLNNFPKLRVIDSHAFSGSRIELKWYNKYSPFLSITDVLKHKIDLDNDDERYIVDVTPFHPEDHTADERLKVYELIKNDDEAEILNKKFTFQYYPRHIPEEKIAKVDAKFGGYSNYSKQNIFTILQKEVCIHFGDKFLKAVDDKATEVYREFYQILGYFSKLWDYINFDIWEDNNKLEAVYTNVDPKYALTLYLFEAVAYYTESKEVYNNPNMKLVFDFINKMIRVFIHSDNPEFKLLDSNLEFFIEQWKEMQNTKGITYTFFTNVVSMVLLDEQKHAQWAKSDDIPYTNLSKAFDLKLWVNLNLPPTEDYEDETLFSTFNMVKHADAIIRNRKLHIEERRKVYFDFINAYRDQNMYMIGISFYLVTYLITYEDMMTTPLCMVKDDPGKFQREMLRKCTNGKRDITLYNISTRYIKKTHNKVDVSDCDSISTFIYLLKKATPLFATKLKKWFKFYNTIIFIDKVDVGTVDGEIEEAFIVVLDKNLKYPYGENDKVAEKIADCISKSKGEVRIYYVG